MLKNFSIRTRALLLSLFCTFLYFVSHSQIQLFKTNSVLQPYIFPLILSAVIFFGLFWVLNFNIKKQRIITIALFSSISIFIISLFFEILAINQSAVGKITTSFISIVIVFAVIYILMLTMNILNFSALADIPLGQAGRTAAYIFSLVILYLVYILIFSSSIFIWFKFSIFFLIVLYYAYALLWNLKLKTKQHIVSSLSVAFVSTLLAMVLSLWPIDTNISVLVMTINLYSLLGISMEDKEKLGSYVWLEYGILLFVIFAYIIYTSYWGINGHLF